MRRQRVAQAASHFSAAIAKLNGLNLSFVKSALAFLGRRIGLYLFAELRQMSYVNYAI